MLKSPSSILSCFFCFCRSGFPSFCRFLLFLLFVFRFLGVHRRLLWLYCLVWFLVLSTWFLGRSIRLACCLHVLAGWLRFLLGFLPHLHFLFLFLAIHLYPLVLICWFLSSFVSAMRATSAFVAFRSDSMFFILLLIPLTFTVIMVYCLFFLIVTCFFVLVFLSWFSYLPGIIFISMGPDATFFLPGGWCCLVWFCFFLALVFFFCFLIAGGGSGSGFIVLGSGFCCHLLGFFFLTSWSWFIILPSLWRFNGLLLLVWCLCWALSSVLYGVLFLWWVSCLQYVWGLDVLDPLLFLLLVWGCELLLRYLLVSWWHDTGNSLKHPTATMRLSGSPLTPAPMREYNGSKGEDRCPFNGQRASASNPVMVSVFSPLWCVSPWWCSGLFSFLSWRCSGLLSVVSSLWSSMSSTFWCSWLSSVWSSVISLTTNTTESETIQQGTRCRQKSEKVAKNQKTCAVTAKPQCTTMTRL